MLTEIVTYHYFLGLRTLTVLQNAVRMANESIVKAGGAYPPGEPSLLGKKIRDNPLGGTFSLSDIPFDDPDVYAYISTGRTDGVFQIESAGMQSFMKELRPESLEDVIAGIALYRPGPMDFIPRYIKGKTDRAGITYDCPEMEPILAPTYGCIVYQEQVMQIVRDLAGYTLGRSDLVRRAMSKKKQSVMEKERRNFVYGNPEEGVPGCLERGIPETVAEHIYDEMMDFAKYAFNKSHAACYAVVTYQTAWLKYYYPLEFMAALMTSVVDFSAKVAGYISACRSMKIRLLPPDINEGEAGFSVSGGAIRYALTAIKGLGRPVIDSIVAERNAGGRFKDLQDFLSRMTGKDREAGRRVIESLIKAGALDCLGHTRKQMMSVYLRILEDLQSSKKNEMAGQMTLFDFADEEDKEDFQIRMPDIGEYSREMMLSFEKEVLGIYVSGHPLEDYEALWKSHVNARASDFMLDEETGQSALPDGKKVTVGGMITEKTVKYTRKNQVMAFVTLEDLTGSVEVVVFPKSYESESPKIREDAKVFVNGRVQLDEGKDAKLICESITSFDQVPRKLWLRFRNDADFLSKQKELMKIIEENGGRDQVVLYIEEGRKRRILPPGQGVRADAALLAKLHRIFENKDVIVQ